MMPENQELVAKGFRSLRGAMAPYVVRELKSSYGANWWERGVWHTLYDEQKKSLPAQGLEPDLINALDIRRCLILFDLHWQEIFRKKLSVDHRTWAKELKTCADRLAHIGGQDFSEDDTWRALDTMSRLCEQLDADSTENIRALLRTFRYGTAEGSTSIASAAPEPKADLLKHIPMAGLLSWREIIEPHPDVAQGRYKNAEFAADLAQVARGEGAYEYRDPVEFFARTFVTEGMAGLLEQALRRVSGRDGEPVIQLKTAFGGGKTHSLLALYHLLRGQAPLEKISGVKPVLQKAGLSELPKVKVAVLVGTALDPTKSRRPQNMPGITVNTLWGEIAAQLAFSAGKPALYDLVKEADKKGVSPGSEALKNLFDACGPCLVLIDELVAYAKKLYGATGLPAGTFDNCITFIQEITEAAKASKNSLVVASIPESEYEIGGEAGQTALGTIEHTIGRLESIWKPVTAQEGFEVVRRRLFLNCKNNEAREAVCAAFSQMYNGNPADFPLEAKELEYKNRLLACYPIHPEVFDRLYEDWATLERFQRTRGVLRLMAAVIHELWMGQDAGLLIMPGSMPLAVPQVRDELTRHLDQGWNAILDREVDGKNAIPYLKDQLNPRYGKVMAARRVARAVMLGSAPSSRSQAVRGLEASRLRLGIVQPGEGIADFNDALGTLQTSLAYLYSYGDRFWYDTRPTLRKTVEDRATQIAEAEVEHEIETRLGKLRKEAPLAGLHVCPGSSLDVPDELSARLVVLRLADAYKAAEQGGRAIQAANDILNNRGTGPRIFRNMLVFLAPDEELSAALKQETRLYLAWRSVKRDSVDLNLDATQNRETETSLKRSDETVDLRLREAWCWLLVPAIDRQADMKTVNWEQTRLSGGNDSLVTKAVKKLIQDEALLGKWAPALLLMELDALLWRNEDSVSVGQLWKDLCTYCYLPRLANYTVLEECIRAGVQSTEFFAYAAGIAEDRFLDLKFNQNVAAIDPSGYLVKREVALKQPEPGTPQPPDHPLPPLGGQGPTTDPDDPPPPTEPAPPTRFFMSAPLDSTRINRDVQKLLEEVINHFMTVPGTKIDVSLEVNINSPNGIPQPLVKSVSENCQTLKVKTFGFEE